MASEVVANTFDTSCSTHPYSYKACPPPILGCRVSGPKSMSFKKSLSGFSNRKFSNLWAKKTIQGSDSDIGICLINIGFCVNFHEQICGSANFLVQPSQIWGPNLISRCTTPIPVTKGTGQPLKSLGRKASGQLMSLLRQVTMDVIHRQQHLSSLGGWLHGEIF